MLTKRHTIIILKLLQTLLFIRAKRKVLDDIFSIQITFFFFFFLSLCPLCLFLLSIISISIFSISNTLLLLDHVAILFLFLLIRRPADILIIILIVVHVATTTSAGQYGAALPADGLDRRKVRAKRARRRLFIPQKRSLNTIISQLESR